MLLSKKAKTTWIDRGKRRGFQGAFPDTIPDKFSKRQTSPAWAGYHNKTTQTQRSIPPKNRPKQPPESNAVS
jgi:hypothetical protein